MAGRAGEAIGLVEQVEDRRDHRRAEEDADHQRHLLAPGRGVDQLAGLEVLQVVVGDGRHGEHHGGDEQRVGDQRRARPGPGRGEPSTSSRAPAPPGCQRPRGGCSRSRSGRPCSRRPPRPGSPPPRRRPARRRPAARPGRPGRRRPGSRRAAASGIRQTTLTSATMPIGMSCSVRGSAAPSPAASARGGQRRAAAVTGPASLSRVQIAATPIAPAPMKRTLCARFERDAAAGPRPRCARSAPASRPPRRSAGRPAWPCRPTARPGGRRRTAPARCEAEAGRRRADAEVAGDLAGEDPGPATMAKRPRPGPRPPPPAGPPGLRPPPPRRRSEAPTFSTSAPATPSG